MSDILEDPALPFMIGRLVGASEMASHLMRVATTTDEALAKQGELLQKVVDWFFDPAHTPTSEQDTKIIPPRL
jgi:hypothetical protein